VTLPSLVPIPEPDPIVPARITAGMSVHGLRIIVIPPPPDDPVRDLRAWGEPYMRDGELVLKVMTEEAWYRMKAGGPGPQLGEWDAYAVGQLRVEADPW
jgi:hypothetical protein